MKIQVNSTKCKCCMKSFFEMDGDDIENCPHCHEDASGAVDEGVKSTVEVTVNPFNGVLIMWDGIQPEKETD